jgi:hypothetical protein
MKLLAALLHPSPTLLSLNLGSAGAQVAAIRGGHVK